MAITDNNVAYWKLDESSGNAADATGDGYTLTNVSTGVAVTYVPCLVNNGSDFGTGNGSTVFKKLSIGNNVTIDGGNVTMAVWAYIYSTGFGDIFSTRSSTSKVRYSITQGEGDAGSVVFERQRQGVSGGLKTTADISVSQNAWHFFVLTYNGTSIAGYIDNVAVTGVATSGNGTATVANETSLGGITRNGGTLAFLPCKTDMAGIWSRVLDSTEVGTLWNSGAGLQLYTTAPATTNAAFLLNFM